MALISDIISWFDAFEIAFITLIVGFLLAKLIQKALSWLFDELKFTSIIPIVLEHALYAATVLFVLFQTGLQMVVYVVAGVWLLALVVFFIFFLKSVAYNAVSRNRVKANFNVGEIVKVGVIKGKIKKIGLLAMLIQNDEEFEVPHSYVAKNLIR